MSFEKDDQFSKHKDILLKPLWDQISHDGRYVITGSKFLQKTHGIDVVIQHNSDMQDATLDTKHVRGVYRMFYFEEMTNTKSNPTKPGWLLKEEGHPDFILYCMHKLCSKCYNNCNKCKHSGIDIIDNITAFWFNFSTLRQWFVENKDRYDLHINNTINATSGRLVPIQDVGGIFKQAVLKQENNIFKTG